MRIMTDGLTRSCSFDSSFEQVEFPPRDPVSTIASSKPEDVVIGRSSKCLTRCRFDSLFEEDGRLVNEHKLRELVFSGGISPDLRSDVWPFLFGLFPCTSTPRERQVLKAEYRVRYMALKERWKEELSQREDCQGLLNPTYIRYPDNHDDNQRSNMPDDIKQQVEFMKIQAKVYAGRHEFHIEDLKKAMRTINKDVPRTDRDIPYFSGDNPNLTVLRDILVTFSAFNPHVGYAQGMNDIVSRFLVVFDSEVEAYWCFTKYMENVQEEFTEHGMLDKIVLVQQLLTELDPVLHKYLAHCEMGDLMFCHRWLLLSFKREFAFEDSLKCFEILCSHHLELSSMEAEKARDSERRRDFEKQGGKVRIEESPYNPSYTFELFLCVAVLVENRKKIFKCTDGVEIFQFINSLTMKLNIDAMLSKAETLFLKYCRKSVIDCFQVVDPPTPEPNKGAVHFKVKAAHVH
ncbi:TBC1 domain family member 15 [Lingula anatina]|uniref:TBC1 domain family member 15 n=1 Tax=Lingula anatina TaxID=7574 RepID=A0A1S3IU07_LINAN|nr:TBC1 domain family member 15 [Lingula anatina]|eukprot:XP_013401563.1 TBC1 domain family member 15 [Lingula anatina]